MRKTIKKVDVVEALLREKTLIQNQWFNSKSTNKPRKGCEVCAVGAILRAMSFEKWAIKNKIRLNTMGKVAVKSIAITEFDAIYDHLEKENYLAALSCYFESGHSKRGCIKFVKDHFPDVLTVTVNIADCRD